MTNQASEEHIREFLRNRISNISTAAEDDIVALVRTEKLKLLAEVRGRKKTYVTELAWKNAATEDAVPVDVLTKLEAEL